MNYLSILGVIITIVILYYLLKYLFSDDRLTTTNNAKDKITISKSKIDQKSKANFTYSIWTYIDDWNYRFGEEKYIISRQNSFSMIFDKEENNLKINVNLASDHNLIHTCTVDDIPIQKWVNILVSVYDRSMDVYINGKLVKTCILENVANSKGQTNVDITPNGGFSGHTASFRYIGDATNPEEAYNIYKKGANSSILVSLLNKYRFKLEFLKDNKTLTSFEI